MARAEVLRGCIAAALVGLACARGAEAQELMLLDPDYTQLISQEVSGDAAYESIRFMTQFHRPRGGSDGLWRVAEYVAQRAEAFGLSDVQIIKQASRSRPWNASFADLWIVEPTPMRIASTLQSVLHLADLSRPADVSGELIDLGAARESDYADKDLAGKIVLTYGSLSEAMEEAVCGRGALGVVWYPSPFSTDQGTSGAGPARPDQLRWIRTPGQGSDGCEPTFAFGLSLRQGLALRQRLLRTEEPIVVRAVVESAFESEQGTEPWQVMVEAYIRGTEPGLGQDIVLTGHLQEEGFSANDDASGSASVLEVGRALNRLIEEGRIPRPRRNIRMWWVTEIGSQRQYFADHPEAHQEIWVNINQDMVGANQAQDVMRKQNVTRLPATRFHFFNDVVESVVEYMVAANTYELAQAQAGAALYPKPHTAHLGTLHRYNAEMIFFHTSSDHMTFLEAPIGVPGVSFTNMPDRFIHSSDDDLWNIDRTQLGRNAAAVALISYIMASADGEAAPGINANTVGRGMERMGRNIRLAFSWVASAQDPERVYFDAFDQIWYAREREALALNSLRSIAPELDDIVDRLIRELDRREDQAVRELEVAYRQAHGERPPQQRAPASETEMELAQIRPSLVAGPTEFLTGRRQLRGVDGLHDLMAFEVLSAVDGRVTALEIYRYVAAEAREAGAHYYGTVTAENVLEYLRNAETAGLVELGSARGGSR
jgi:hypothetical protein